MAIFKASAIVGGISGNIGGANFVNARGSAVIRKAKSRTGTRTTAQMKQSAELQWNIQRWNAFTDDEKLLWNLAANQQTFPNRLGEQRYISGYQFFLKSQSSFYLDTPPALLPNQPQVDITFTSSVAGGLDVDIASDGPATFSYSRIRGMLLYRSTAIKSTNFFRTLGWRLAMTGTVSDITSMWETVFPLPVLGQYVALRFEPLRDFAPTGQVFEQIIETTA